MSAPRYEWHIGDARRVLATLEAGSVSCVVTSPPYLAKRAYLPDEHPDKTAEIGQETTPADYLARLLETTNLLWDVLADDGVAFINLGDSAAFSGGSGGDYNPGGLREGQARYEGTAKRATRWARAKDGWPRAKSVCWIPELFGASLAYGCNLLTGEPCHRWVTRPSITWCKPNPSVGECIDKFREATELFVFAAKQGAYWFNLDSLRTPPKGGLNPAQPVSSSAYEGPGEHETKPNRVANDKGAPPLNWQVIPPAQYSGAHFAVMPMRLASMLIQAACPPAGTVLDPFAGSGTTLEAALGHGRSAIGIDLDSRNVALVRDRMGLFPVEVVEHAGSKTDATGDALLAQGTEGRS